jgi:hypothetical protein|tara:strand:- start:5425 stop:5697 length:273 start_codon:yes stop_codon:yes gene_type:complete
MPVVAGREYPYTEEGIAAAEAARKELALLSQIQRPYSYEDLLRGIERLPVSLVGDPRRPAVRATIPLEDQLALSLEGNPYGAMGLLRGRW